MNKAIMQSVSPQQCEQITSGEQTILLVKRKPKLETPFKDYIYMTKRKERLIGVIHKGDDIYGTTYDENAPLFIKTYADYSLIASSLYGKEGKIIGEFVCDHIQEYQFEVIAGLCGYYDGGEKHCLTRDELWDYGQGKPLYALHISDLVIYDKPKELGEFKKAGFMTEEQWLYALYPNTHCHYDAWAKKFELTRPPQSWCYVEEV